MFTPPEAEALSLLLARASGSLRGYAQALGDPDVLCDAADLDRAGRDLLTRALRATT